MAITLSKSSNVERAEELLVQLNASLMPVGMAGVLMAGLRDVIHFSGRDMATRDDGRWCDFVAQQLAIWAC